MKVAMLVAAALFGAGCRSSRQFTIELTVPPTATLAALAITQTVYSSDATAIQTKTFPFDIGRGAKLQAIPLP